MKSAQQALAIESVDSSSDEASSKDQRKSLIIVRNYVMTHYSYHGSLSWHASHLSLGGKGISCTAVTSSKYREREWAIFQPTHWVYELCEVNKTD